MRRALLMLVLLGAVACPPPVPPNPPGDAGQPGPCLDRPGAAAGRGNTLPCELYPPKN
jgi:hypothetical protein